MKIFQGFLPYTGMEATLILRPMSFELVFNLPLPKGCIWNLIKIGPTVSEKSFKNVKNHSILSYHRLPLFRKNATFHLFSIQTPKGPNLTLMKNDSQSNYGHHLNKFGSTQSLNATYQFSRQSTQRFWNRRFFKVFIINGLMAIMAMRPGPFERIFNLPLPGCCI